MLLVPSSGGQPGQIFATRIGENQSSKLDDGSHFDLNTNSRLEWLGNPKERVVALHHGEVYFDIVSDPARPFHIILPNTDTEIWVLGTQFDVYRKANGSTVVTVLSGKVGIEFHGSAKSSWQRELSADQCLEFQGRRVLADVKTSRDPKSAISWREGVMQVPDMLLPDVIAEMQRYTTKPIIVSDPRFKRLHLVGNFKITDIKAALIRMTRVAPITLRDINGAFVLEYKDPRDRRTR